MRAQQYRDRITSWQASGGATDGTVVSFWVDADAVEIDHSDATRLRIKVYGRDILTPLGYPVPSPPADKRYPVQVHMFVNRLTVGPMLDAEETGDLPDLRGKSETDEIEVEFDRPVRRLPAAVELLPGRCEAMGVVPVKLADLAASGLAMAIGQRPAPARAGRRPAHARRGPRGRRCDGWHFVQCPDCGGSGEIASGGRCATCRARPGGPCASSGTTACAATPGRRG
jgi:hypothetical protein